MRGFKKSPVIPDIVSLLAVVALVTVVYLCSLPQSLRSLDHRKADAAILMGQSRLRLQQEGLLFAKLLAERDLQRAGDVHRQLIANQQHFHRLTGKIIEELPEATASVAKMIGSFDHLAQTGWQIESAARGRNSDNPQSLLDAEFLPALNDLDESSRQIEETLQQRDTKLPLS